MKIYHIALFTFIVLNMMAFLGSVLAFDEKPTAQSWALNKITENVYEMDSDPGILEALYYIAIASFYAILALLSMLVYTTILLPLVFIDLGLPTEFAILLTGPIWITYAAGVVQLWGNRSIRGG